MECIIENRHKCDSENISNNMNNCEVKETFIALFLVHRAPYKTITTDNLIGQFLTIETPETSRFVLGECSSNVEDSFGRFRNRDWRFSVLGCTHVGLHPACEKKTLIRITLILTLKINWSMLMAKSHILVVKGEDLHQEVVGSNPGMLNNSAKEIIEMETKEKIN